MAKRKIRVGIVGTGGIAKACHIPGWQAHDDVEIVAVCDINKKRAVAAAEEHNIPNAFKDFKELVKLKEIDIVDICTPNMVHTPAVIAALNAGKHVICEKPLAVTTAEVKKMGLTAKKKRRKLMTAQHQRFGAEAVSAKKFVDSGRLGEIYHARTYALRRDLLPIGPGFIDKRLSGGGPCMDIGVHALDLCMFLMGFPKPVSVTGTSRVNFAKGRVIPGAWGEWNRKLYSVEDFATGFVRFDDGSTLMLEASWLGHYNMPECMKCQIYGKRASLEWPSGEFSTARDRVLQDGTLSPVKGLMPPHTAELFAFYDCVVNNKPSPVPVEETIKVIGILEGIYKSEKVNREVKITL
jgi:predicted dehydrogenase